jgi:hypothetical protein
VQIVNNQSYIISKNCINCVQPNIKLLEIKETFVSFSIKNPTYALYFEPELNSSVKHKSKPLWIYSFYSGVKSAIKPTQNKNLTFHQNYFQLTVKKRKIIKIALNHQKLL